MFKRKMIIAAIIFLTIGIALYRWEVRSVKLEHIATLTIEPPLSELINRAEPVHAKEWTGLIDHSKGKQITESFGNYLSNNNREENAKIKINWDKIRYDENTIYFACLGCEIKEIKYEYHTKYKYYYKKHSRFNMVSVSRKPVPGKSIINVYKGDVDVWGKEEPCLINKIITLMSWK